MNMHKRFSIAVIAMVIIAIIVAVVLSNQTPELPTQKWDSNEWTFVGEFEMEGMNVTPLKEIATDQYDFVEVRVDKYSTEIPVYFLLEVYYYQGEALPVSKLVPLGTSGENVVIKCPVKKGSIFQVLTQVYTEEGEYNKDLPCTLGYSYRLVKD